MPIDLHNVFKTTDTVLNKLLSKYKGLRFIGFDQQNENKPYYLTDEITTGFFYKTKKTPVTGQVIERLRIVPSDDATEEAISKTTMLELIEANGNFCRFSYETEKEPEPPNFEWVLLIVPNKQDTEALT